MNTEELRDDMEDALSDYVDAVQFGSRATLERRAKAVEKCIGGLMDVVSLAECLSAAHLEILSVPWRRCLDDFDLDDGSLTRYVYCCPYCEVDDGYTHLRRCPWSVAARACGIA